MAASLTPKGTQGTLLRITDLSRLLGLPESTIRYYCKRFDSLLPQVGHGRQRRYLPEALAILQELIAPLRREKGSTPERTPLPEKIQTKPMPGPQAKSFPSDPGVLFAGQIMELMERQTQALQHIAVALETLASRRNNEVMLLPETIAENAMLRSDIESLRQHLQTSEDSHKKDLEKTRKWLALLSEAMSKRSV